MAQFNIVNQGSGGDDTPYTTPAKTRKVGDDVLELSRTINTPCDF